MRDSRISGVSIIILVLFVVLAIIWFLPTLPFNDSVLTSSGLNDPPQSVWSLAWTRFAFLHGLNPFQTNFLDYPSGVNLADNTLMLFLGIASMPITVLFGPIASFNFLLTAALATSASAMFFLVRALSPRPIIAAIAGLLYGFGPYMATESRGSAHLDLAFVPIPPLILLCLLAISRRRIRPPIGGLLIGCLAGAQALIAPEVLIDITVILGLGAVVAEIVYRPSWATMRVFLNGVAIAGGVFVIIVGYPAWYALFGPNHISGPVQPTSVLQLYSADLLGPIVPTARQFFAPARLVQISNRFVDSNATENLSYLGIPFVFVLISVGVLCRRNRLLTGVFFLAIISFVLSLGSRLTIAGHVTHIPLPEAIFPHIPLLESIVPARFALEVVLFGSLALAIGLDQLLSLQLSSRISAVRTSIVSISLLACLVPLWPSSSTSPTQVGNNKLVSALRKLPNGSVVLTYPYPISPYSTPMVWQALANMNIRLIGGYAWVKGPPGVGAGVPWSPLLSPPSVQEFLAQSEGYNPYPSSPGAEGDLCQFVRNYRVSAIADVNLGTANDATVASYFRSRLGNPQVSDSSLSIYITHATSCY